MKEIKKGRQIKEGVCDKEEDRKRLSEWVKKKMEES